jgi:hypothetical protein
VIVDVPTGVKTGKIEITTKAGNVASPTRFTMTEMAKRSQGNSKKRSHFQEAFDEPRSARK